MRTPIEHQQGIVAILDALGASNYGDAEVRRFLESRTNVLRLLNEKVEGVLGGIDSDRVATFTFNDTILLTLKCGIEEADFEDIGSIFAILRKFLVDSMKHRILFRGSISIGSFYVDEQANTVMGQAVTDAAAWYDRADWIGIHATPLATMKIQRWLEGDSARRDNLILDYDVPLKGGGSVKAKAVNWPKAFSVRSISPCQNGEKPRAKLLEFLALHPVPVGTESKYFNTLAFFDHAEKLNRTQERARRWREKSELAKGTK